MTAASMALVGRELPLSDLRRAAEGAAAGTLRVAVVEGPSGIGKSALAQAFTAELSSWRLVRVRNDPEDSVRSFGAVQATLQALAPGHRITDFHTVTDAAVAVFAALDHLDSPVCLRIEDAQWLDSDSEEVFFTVARQGHHARLLLLIESQPRTMGLASRLRRLATSLDGGVLIHLEPFNAETIRAFFIQRLGTALNDQSVQTLLQVTGGVPLYVDSISRRLQAGGNAARSLQSAVADLLHSHRRYDDVAAQEVREELASSGPEMRWALLMTALAEGLAYGEMEAALAQLGCAAPTRAELWRQPLMSLDSMGALRLRHGILRECLVDEASSAEVLRVHRVLSEVFTDDRALTHEYQLHEQQHSPELAQRLSSAARGALKQRQIDQACRWALWAASLDPSHLVSSVLIYAECGRFDRLVELQPLFPAQAADLGARAYRALTNLDDPAVVAEFDVVDPDELSSLEIPEVILVAHAVFHVARVRAGHGDFGQPRQAIAAVRHELDARGLATTRADPNFASEMDSLNAELRRHSADLRVWQAFNGLNQKQVIELCERHERLADELKQDPATAHAAALATHLMASSRFLSGNYPKARAAIAATRRFDDMDWQITSNLKAVEARMDFYAGAWDEAHRGLQRALSRSWGDREDISSLLVRACSALVPFCRGELETAGQELASVTAAAGGSSYSAALAMAGFVQAWGTVASRGPAETVIGSLAPLWASTLGGTYATVPTAVILCRALVDDNQLEPARKLVTDLDDYEADPQLLNYVTAHCEGVVAAAERRYQQAQNDFQRAAASIRGIEGRPLRLLEVILAEDTARLAISQQLLPHPSEGLDEAIALLQRVRSPIWADALEELRAQVSEKTTPEDPETDVPRVLTDLTSRERDVALRVAHGLSNREIATEDVVSVRTVEYHVSNILRKTHLRSRIELRRSIQKELSTL